MDAALKNMQNAGAIFMCSVWLQSQMSDLVIFKTRPSLVDDFLANRERVPDNVHALRLRYWEKDFREVKGELLAAFNDVLTAQDSADIEQVYEWRNAIAHAHVSVARPYMLYRPSSKGREQRMMVALKPEMRESSSQPLILKLHFDEALFQRISDLIARVDQDCFARLAVAAGIEHSRIR